MLTMMSLNNKFGVVLGIIFICGNLVSSQWQQEGPINCYKCEGSECANTLGKNDICRGEGKQSCATVFSEDASSVIARGCSQNIDTSYSSYCDRNSDKCQKCTSNGCNNAKALNEYVKCLSCDSQNDKNCVLNPNSITTTKLCHKSCMVALYVKNTSDHLNLSYELSRSCLDDKELDDRKQCSEGSDDFCKACDNENCNVDYFPKHRFKCFQCNGADCEEPRSEYCVRYDETEQCYFEFDQQNTIVKLGCRSDLPHEDVVTKVKSKKLVLCDGVECNFFDNTPTPTHCKVCSSENEANCAVNPSQIRQNVLCSTPYPQCYSMISNDGKTTSRGCINELQDDTFYQCLTGGDQKCQICNGENCNEKEMGNKNNLTMLIREPVGDTGIWQELPLNCYTCDGEHCATSNGVTKKCLDNDLQTCLTVFNQIDNIIARGCKDEVLKNYANYCQTNPTDCLECKSNGCNLASSKTDYVDCIFCDSMTNEKCVFDVQNVKETRKCHKACMTALYPRTSDAEPSYNLVRSCLDDKDLDDRETCDSDQFCHSCSSGNSLCNTQLIPDEPRKICQHCLGESCQIPIAEGCQSYTNHEQCFIKFLDKVTISEMGCKSDFDPQDILSMLLSKKLFLCDEDNCNQLENLPTAHSCRLCNSRTDKFCATDPRNVATSTLCNQFMSITSCYSRLLSDGHVERGCLSSLHDEEFLKCYNNNNTTECRICDEDVCNDEIFPSDRLACHTCNSAEDKTCEANPRHSTVCHKYFEDQTCITTLQNEITHRGCSSELSCDLNDKTTCRSCNTTSCNVFNLKRLTDANPGVWQNLPLNCYTCSGADCHQSALTRISMCFENDNQHCMTVFNSDGIVTRRGCSDDVERELSEYCDEFSEKCFNCNSNGCNNASRIDDYINCIHCDSRINKDCVQDLTAIVSTRRCNTACMVALLPRSENETSILELSRSCLDDKDLNDREVCGQNGSLCKSCFTDNCNHNDVVEDRLECNSCLNENCNNPISKKCTVLVENDSCFILFDDNSSIKQSGCTSEFTPDELEEHQDKIIKCNQKNCNDNSIIPIPQICYKCNSLIDPKCASSPKDLVLVTECSSLPNVECYTKVYNDGSTTRGCVSELSRIERQACLNGNDEFCLSCFGNKCNAEVFPEDRLSCHKCNSLDDPNCQDHPDSSVVCSVYSQNDVCSTKLVDGVTYRGCGNDDFTCDDSDKQYCKMCNTSNCNVVNLYQNNIGYPGNWQDLPINCLTCLDQECDSSSTTHLRKCENNFLQNCVTVFDSTGKVIQRGCSDTINSGPNDHYCDSNADRCISCKSTGCNNANSLSEYVTCLSCDSSTNPSCTLNVSGVSKTRKCKGKCMTALYPRAAESDPSFELTRSCLDDKDLDDRIECDNGNDEFCKTCQGNNCNVDQLPAKRLSCYRCVGDNCEEPTQAVCPSYRENDACLILFDSTNEVAQMGCKSDFDNSQLELLRKKMLFCEGDNCNYFDILPTMHACVTCNSTENPSCATKPDSLNDYTDCNSLPYTSCYTMIEDGHTVRGCIADLELAAFDKCLGNSDDSKCKVCDDENCNKQLYPEDRQICYRCSSADDQFCQSTPADSSACLLYQENDQCSVAIAGETTIRGCSSEVNCDGNDRETCRNCPDNNCNTIDLLSNYVGKPGQWQDLPLTCFSCEGPTCQNSNGQPKKCDNNNLQKCETVFNSAGEVVQRGCSDEVAEKNGDYCDKNSGFCVQCKSSGCNTVKQLSEYIDCNFCDSSANPDCVLKPTEVARTRKCNKQCMVALFPRSSEEDPSYELSRSCLDDKDFDDRQDCIDNKDSLCQACSGPKCNDFEFPTERHQCISCRGEECDDAKSQQCVLYHPSDQCYILFDNSSSIVAMGCRSEYEHQSVNNLIKAKQMLLCNGKDCNTYDSVPDSQSCVVCNSATDPLCATNPNLIANSTTCSQLPYTGCFTLINEDGDTERGCQSALEASVFFGCHTQSDSACSICSGNNCNKEVFPADRTTCHRCNSLDDGERCATSPSSNGACPKFIENESCVTSYFNGVTYRDCSSELSCDESNKKICRVCSGSGCNTHNLEYVAKDGEPGKWQDLPIKCHTCKDATCKQTSIPVEICSNNNLQNCMTVFNSQGEVIQRGCSDAVNEVQESYCEQNNDKCFRCNSNECNIATSPNDYVQCLSCDSNTNSSCVNEPESWKNSRMCYKGCMTALYPISMEEDPAYATVRSCLDDKELPDQQTCTAVNDELCKSCQGTLCNKDQFPNDRRSCLHCSGDGCQEPKSKLCSGYRKNDQCSLLLDSENTIQEAGCKSDYTIDQTITLIKKKRLFLCDGNNCNTFDAIPNSHSCSLCNSKTDPTCAVEPNASQGFATCKKQPYTQCYTRVLSDGATERGCLSNLEENDFYDCLVGNATTCESCLGEKCNTKVYPVGRRSCLICDSDSDPNCHSKPSASLLSICPKYVENDACVTSFIAGTTYRGCESDIQCDSSDRKKCRVCTSDGCNTIDLERKQDDNYGKWQDLPLMCYECKDNECNSLGEAKQCQNNNEQDCSMVYDAGKVIRRGCSDDIDAEFEDKCDDDSNSIQCFNCKSNRCNAEAALNEFTECIYCDSVKNKSCVTSPTSIQRTRKCSNGCMTALYPSDSSSNPAYELIRTCLNDKEQQDQDKCEEPFCKSCQGDKCNSKDLPTDRLRCYSCQNENCENPVSELCPLYKNNDQCFVRFDSSNSIAEMGCLSAFRDHEVIDILKTKRVYICEGENCNVQENLPREQKCVICDSKDDVNCAINAQQVGTVGSCNSLPYPNCHTSIASDGTTFRGCLADLPADDFASCILSGGDKCSQCLGNGCNRETFPENRLQCYTCDSETDPDCADIPTQLSSCPYIRDSEKCVTALGGNRTERGCASQLLCDTTDRSTCRHCSSSGCNSLNLVDFKDDGNHGMWQELPLKCYNCSGTECSHSLGPAVVCTGGDQQDCMTVFDEKENVVRRGCEFDVEDEKDLYCRQNPDNCVRCKSNECNDGWDLRDYLTCAYCNSATDPKCVTRPADGNFATRKCQYDCMTASYQAANGTTQVIRTCLDDKELQDRRKCYPQHASTSDCLSCVRDNCNLKKYPLDRLTCNVCTGTDCSSTTEEHCAAYVKDDKCYAKYESNQVELSGCLSDMDDLAIQEWREKSQLYDCSEENCNAPNKLPTAQSCISCDSDKNAECATYPSVVNQTEVCNAPINSCMIRIANRATQRGCLNSLSYNDQTLCGAGSNLCDKCTGEKCNSKIYPSGRRSCYICQSDKHDNCIKDPEPNRLSVCPNYSNDNQCVTKFDGKITERGCTTELTCDVSDKDHCQICSVDGCNTQQLDGVGTILANNLLLTILVVIVGVRGVTSQWL